MVLDAQRRDRDGRFAMSGRRVLVLLVIAAVAWYFYTHRSGVSAAASSSSSSSALRNTSPGNDCLARAESADRDVAAAAALVSHPPVDASAWQSAESSALAAISSAESGCGAPPVGKEGEAVVELRAALSSMRSLMGDLSAAAKGTGGATEVARTMEDIDNHMEKARSILR
jgi:hypothetical protein